MYTPKPWMALLVAGLWLGGCGDTDVTLQGDIESDPLIGEGDSSSEQNDNQGTGNHNQNSDPNGNTGPNQTPNTGNHNNTNNDPVVNNTNNDPVVNNTNNDPNHQNGDPPQLQEGFCDGSFIGCGGNPAGEWTLDRLCTEQSIDPVFLTLEPEACHDGQVDDFTIDGSGTLSIDSDTEAFSHQIDADVSGEVSVDDECAQDLDGCAPVKQQLEIFFVGASADCSQQNGCTCTLSGTLNTDISGDYVLEGGQLSVDGISYDYCAESNWLTFSQLDGDDHFALTGRYERQ